MSLLIKHCMEYGKSLITDNSLSVEPPETCSKRLKSRAQSQGLQTLQIKFLSGSKRLVKPESPIEYEESHPGQTHKKREEINNENISPFKKRISNSLFLYSQNCQSQIRAKKKS